MISRGVSIGLALVVAAGSVRGDDQPAQAAKVVLTVDGEVNHPLKLTVADLAKMPRHTVKAKDHKGTEAEFTGVALHDILKEAGVTTGEGLRGQKLALYLVVEASDGYRAVFSLPEIDPAFNDRTALLVDLRDGKALASSEGPLRIVVPGEKRHARWVRQVVTLRVGKA